MVTTIKELIEKKEAIEAKKKEKIVLKTSIGDVVAVKPSASLITESLELDDGNDEYFLLNSIVEPNLKDPELQAAYGCVVPTGIISKLFQYGEVKAMSSAIMDKVGAGKKIETAVYEEIKN